MENEVEKNVKNKELENPVPKELDDGLLDNVSGGITLNQIVFDQGPYCSECGQSSSGSLFYRIDGKRYCTACKERLFG